MSELGLGLGDLRSVDRADVYKAGRLAAELERRSDEVSFRYLAEYVDAGGPPVASTLPISKTPIITTAGAVPSFFAGLLPEGVRLQAVITGTKTSPDDHLTLLCRLCPRHLGGPGSARAHRPAWCSGESLRGDDLHTGEHLLGTGNPQAQPGQSTTAPGQ